MSLKALVWAFDQRVGSSSPKLVLLKLADNFNDETGVCYPSVGYIAEHTELNEKTVRICLKKLASMGFISAETRRIDGTNLTNIYRLNLGGVLPKLGVGGVLPKTVGGTPKLGRGVLPKLGDEPVIESVINHTLIPQKLAEDWNQEFQGKLPLVRLPLTGSRKRKAALRLIEHPDEKFWDDVFTNIYRSKFLTGNGSQGWRCTFDFLIANDSNCLKIAEGVYANRSQER